MGEGGFSDKCISLYLSSAGRAKNKRDSGALAMKERMEL